MTGKQKQLDKADLKLLRAISPPHFSDKPLGTIANETAMREDYAMKRLKRMEKLGYVKMRKTADIVSFGTTEYGSITGQLSATYERLGKIDTELGRYAASEVKVTLETVMGVASVGGNRPPLRATIYTERSRNFP
ncbi:MAG: hypothetical protein KGH98_03805 [Candidatus Micrarchaeota archaeon]|nr:hypothetical protein [Candidatus Micrarchaeota archaeon]